MLVLSRKLGQRIVVPQSQVAITVLRSRGTAVRLGVCAPDDNCRVSGRSLRNRQQFDGRSRDNSLEHSRMERLAAELADAAYIIALRAETENSWIHLELRLWKRSPEPFNGGSRICCPRVAQKRLLREGEDGSDRRLDEPFSLAASAGET